MYQDEAIIKHRFHRVVIGVEIRTEVTLVELHTFHNAECGFDALGFFYGYGSILADLIHCIGDDFNFSVPVGGNGRDLANFLAIGDLFAVAK